MRLGFLTKRGLIGFAFQTLHNDRDLLIIAIFEVEPRLPINTRCRASGPRQYHLGRTANPIVPVHQTICPFRKSLVSFFLDKGSPMRCPPQ